MVVPYSHSRASVDVARNAPAYTPDHQQPSGNLLCIYGYEVIEGELVKKVPRRELITAVMAMLARGAEERGRKEVERHGADEGYPREDEVQALLPVNLEEVDVEDPHLATESDHTRESYHPGFTGMGMDETPSIW